MRTVLLCALLAALAAGGCVTKKKEQLAARQAYIAGQEQAMQAAAQARQQPQGPVVYVQGPVRNPVVEWKEGLTLSQAIVAAEYTAFMNPLLIRVLRNGQVAGEFKGIDLLRHQDMDLEAGDTVVITP